MKLVERRRLLAVVAAFGWSTIAFAQGAFVLPAATPNTPVICSTCVAPYTGLPAVGYSLPIKTFVGRYCDSSYTNDFQTPFRTARAGVIKIAAERNRIYMRIGSAIAAYPLDTFFTQRLAQMMPASQVDDLAFSGTRGLGNPQDVFTVWDKFVYPETVHSGWEIHNVDGQDRLYGMDWDDRGYVYSAYHTFGWGINFDDGGNDRKQMTFVSQQMTAATASNIVSLKAGTRYLALVTFNGTPSVLYDVTDPAHPAAIRNVPNLDLGSDIGGRVSTRNLTHDVLAVVGLGQSFKLYSAASLITSDTPFLNASGYFSAINSDGTNFFATRWDGRTLGLSIFAQSGSGYVQNDYNTGLPFLPTSIHGDSGFLVVGSYLTENILVYKLQNLVPVAVPMTDYFLKFYYFSPAGNAHANRIVMYDALVYKQGAKFYLMVSYNSLGDVYEIQAGDALSASVVKVGNTPGNAPTGSPVGPFPGDAVTFTGSSSNGSPQVTWDFGNSEAAGQTADGLRNTTPAMALGQTTHQYNGITSFPTTRTVNLRTIDGSADPASVSVQLQKPTPRIRIRNTQLLFTQPNASSPAQIVTDDLFEDDSDGAVEGHVASWSLSADGSGLTMSTKAAPTTTFAALGQAGWGACGQRTLGFDATYGPYDSSFNAINTPYNVGIHSLTYALRPFAVGGITYTAIPPDSGHPLGQIRFSAAPRIPADLTKVLASGTSQWTVNWQLTGGTSPPPPQSSTVAIGTSLPDWTVDKNNTTTGSVSIAVSIPSADLLTACKPFASVSQSVAIVKPNPQIAANCSTTSVPCTVTDTNTADDSSWTYAWTMTLNNAPVSGGVSSGKTFTFPSSLSAGTYQVTLIVTNAFGTGTSNQLSVTLAAPACSSNPDGKVSLSYLGSTSRCYAGGCTSGEPIIFSLGTFGYSLSACDTWDWNFGDNTRSTSPSPVTHTFPGTGPYTVTLVLNGGGGSATVTSTVTFGSGNPNPGGCQGSPTSSNVSMSFFGSSSHCYLNGNACTPGETIQFTANSAGYTFNAACDSYDWDFGDGTTHSSLAAPTHAYAAGGPYTVTLRLSGGAGTGTIQGSVQMTGGSTNCSAPGSSSLSLSYLGTTSQCYVNGTPCTPNEAILFSARSSPTGGYTFNDSCDRYDWDFGDTTPHSNAKAPSHAYSGTGPYNVILNLNGTTFSTLVRFTTGSCNGSPNSGTVSLSFLGQTSRCYLGGGPCTTGEPITFQLNSVGYSFNDACDKYDWNFGDQSAHLTAKSPTYTYSSGGPFTVQVTIDGGAGKATLSGVVSFAAVTPPEPPEFTFPPVAAVGQPVDFTIIPAANSKAIQWIWDFGDHLNSATTTQKKVTNTYNAAGTYPVTVIAKSASGTILGQTSHSITISKPRRRGTHGL